MIPIVLLLNRTLFALSCLLQSHINGKLSNLISLTPFYMDRSKKLSLCPNQKASQIHKDHPMFVNKSLYGLKQVPWKSSQINYISRVFKAPRLIFLCTIKKTHFDIVFCLIYMDDLIVTCSNPSLISHIISALKSSFAV